MTRSVADGRRPSTSIDRGGRSAVDLVRHLTGIQAQSLPAARLAFPARTEGLTAERVDRARLRDRSIVHTWAMRGTLFLIAAEDFGWLVPLVLEPRIQHAFRRLEQEGVPTDQPVWSGIRAGDAKRAWAGIDDRLVEVATDRGPLWSLRRSAGEAPSGLVRLIPWWDEYLLGWKDRHLGAPPDQWRQINRDGGGWLNPTILVDGLAVGLWNPKPTPKALHVEIQPFSSLSSTVRRGIRREAEHLSDFLGPPVKPVYADGPQSGRQPAHRARRRAASGPPPDSSPRPSL